MFPAWAEHINRFMQEFAEAGCVALERGKKMKHLHCQCIFRLHWDPTKLDQLKTCVRHFCGTPRGDGLQTVIEAKIFEGSQRWDMMVGYCMKDAAQPHFVFFQKGISDAEIKKGVDDSSRLTS